MNSFFPPNFHPKSRSESLLTQDAKDETLIYDLTNNRALCLNQTASAIWFECNGKKNINEIIKTIKEKHNIDSNEELITLTLHELNQNDLLIKTDQLQQISETFNRREMLKKIGYTTAFALPVITSLVAPMATQAQSQPQQAFCSINCDASAPNSCNCTAGSYPCPGGGIITINASAGVCVGLGIGITIPGIPINVGAGVCLYTGICVSV